MIGWDYATQAARVRGNPLGHVGLKQTANNFDILARGIEREHFVSGAKATHNALEIPRAVGRVGYSAGSYSLSNFNTSVASVASSASGSIEVTVDGDYYDSTGRVFALINCNDEFVADKPWVTGFEWVSATSVRVYQRSLTSALGAGNTFAANDQRFDLALFSLPVIDGDLIDNGYTHPRFMDFVQGGGLRAVDDELTNIRGLVRNQGRWMAQYALGHDVGSNEHTALETAREVGTIINTAGTYSVSADADFASVSKIGTGQVEITLSGSYTNAASLHPFAHADNIGTGWINTNVYATAADKIRVYSYNFDGTNWARVDTSFFVVLFAD